MLIKSGFGKIKFFNIYSNKIQNFCDFRVLVFVLIKQNTVSGFKKMQYYPFT